MRNKVSSPSLDCNKHSETGSASMVTFLSVQNIFLCHPAYVILVSENGKCVWWNHAAGKLLGELPRHRGVLLHEVAFGLKDFRITFDQRCEGSEVLFIGRNGGVVVSEAFFSQINVVEYGVSTLIIATNKSTAHTRSSRRENTAMETEEFETIVSLSPVTALRFSVQDDLYPNYISDSIKQFGYTPRDFYTGKRCFWSILHQDDITLVKSALFGSLKKMVHNLTLHFRIMTAMGQERCIEGLFHLRDYHTSALREFQGVLIDITGIKSYPVEGVSAEYPAHRKFPITLVE